MTESEAMGPSRSKYWWGIDQRFNSSSASVATSVAWVAAPDDPSDLVPSIFSFYLFWHAHVCERTHMFVFARTTALGQARPANLSDTNFSSLIFNFSFFSDRRCFQHQPHSLTEVRRAVTADAFGTLNTPEEP